MPRQVSTRAAAAFKSASESEAAAIRKGDACSTGRTLLFGGGRLGRRGGFGQAIEGGGKLRVLARERAGLRDQLREDLQRLGGGEVHRKKLRAGESEHGAQAVELVFLIVCSSAPRVPLGNGHCGIAAGAGDDGKSGGDGFRGVGGRHGRRGFGALG